jgi:hypothetical protein
VLGFFAQPPKYAVHSIFGEMGKNPCVVIAPLHLSAGRRHLPWKTSLQCHIYASKPLSVKSFHGRLTGNVQEYSLKSSIGKVRLFFCVRLLRYA